MVSGFVEMGSADDSSMVLIRSSVATVSGPTACFDAAMRWIADRFFEERDSYIELQTGF